MNKNRYLLALGCIAGLFAGCSDSDCDSGICKNNYGVNQEYSVTHEALDAMCQVTVAGAVKDMETDYIPHVTLCENGASNSEEALKIQAVSARSTTYYKKFHEKKDMEDSQSDQVYTCNWDDNGLKKTQAATDATSGVILRYNGKYVCTFYVAGTVPGSLDSDCKSTSKDGTQQYVTYNWGKTGSNVQYSPIGVLCDQNRGCMSQNGATCLGRKGWVWENIARFFYGMDIEIVQTSGSCVNPPKCTTTISKSGDKIDDTDGCFSRTPSEKWFRASAGEGGSSQFAYTWNGAATATGTWKINMAKAGTFEVFAYADPGIGALSANAPYTVRANGKETAVNVNMNGKSGWISIGTFTFAAGGDQWVKLTDASGEAYTDTNGKRVVYDAIKFEEKASACTNACTENKTQCSGNGVQTCRKGSDGCTVWSKAVACNSDETCNAGVCTKNGSTCTNVCQINDRECVNNDRTAFRTCITNANSCTEWSEAEFCPEGQICNGGSCVDVSSCQNECREDEVSCSGNGYKKCEPDSNNCLKWSDVTACNSDEVCRNGECKRDANEEGLPDECQTAIDGRDSTIIDETDTCFVRSESSRWMKFTDYGYENHLEYSYVQYETASTIGTWYLNVKKSGKYKISVYIIGAIGDVLDVQQYTVKAGKKIYHPEVEITTDDNGWMSLGSFELTEDELQYIRLDNLTNSEKDAKNEKRVIFDAVKIVPSDKADSEDPSNDASTLSLSVESNSCSMGTHSSHNSWPFWMMIAGFAGIGLICRRTTRHS